jgi:Protein of unknown function (DUF1292)
MTTSSKNSNCLKEAVVTLISDNGSNCLCRIIDTIEFDPWKYALLSKMDGDELGTLVVLRVAQGDHSVIFEAIDDDAEFDFVLAEFEKQTEISARTQRLAKNVF